MWLLSNGVNTRRIHRRSTKVLRKLYQQNHCPWTERDKVQNEKGPLDPQNSSGRKQTKKTTHLQTQTTETQTLTIFHEKERITQKMQSKT